MFPRVQQFHPVERDHLSVSRHQRNRLVIFREIGFEFRLGFPHLFKLFNRVVRRFLGDDRQDAVAFRHGRDAIDKSEAVAVENNRVVRRQRPGVSRNFQCRDIAVYVQRGLDFDSRRQLLNIGRKGVMGYALTNLPSV